MSETEITVMEPAIPQTMNLIQMATEKGADLPTLQGYFDLHRQWEDNEARKAFVVAMTGFQAECPAIKKTKKGHNSAKYAGLSEAIEQIKKLESKYGLSHNWKESQSDGAITVECFVTHVLGHRESSSLSAAPDTSGSKNDVQAIGSTDAYLKRYTLFSVFGLAAGDDDDDAQALNANITPEQVKILEDRLEACGADKIAFCKHMKVPALTAIPAKAYGKADNMIRAKEAQAK